MKLILRFEELVQMVTAVVLLAYLSLDMAWWIGLIAFFAPDVSILAYVFGNRTGSVVYNIFHHKGLASVMALAGLASSIPLITAAGLLLFAHAAFDRMLGYGLKYPDSFRHTHLGIMGKTRG